MGAELKYYKDQLTEAQLVIRQLVEGVKEGEAEYIHPFDLFELLEALSFDRVLTLLVKDDGDPLLLTVNGKQYRQSTLLPARTKRFT